MNANATTLAMVSSGSASCFAVSQVRRARRGGLTRRTNADANTANKHDVPEAESRFNV